ncbi:MAG: MFS transporter, partial [Longimicrobiales bacterium]
PVLGGWLIDAVSWRAIFLINPFLAALTILVARRYVPATTGARAEGAIDVPGALTAALALGGIVFALIEGPERGWGSLPVIAAGVTGCAMLVAFLLIEARSSRAMLPLWCFRSKAFAGANATTLFVYGALGGVFFLLTIQLQRVVGYSPLEAGLATTPMTLLLLLLSPLAGRIYDRIGPRVPMTIGPLIGGAGVALLGRTGPASGYVTDVLPGILVFGTGLGITVAPLTSAALAALPDEQSGIAAGVNNAIARTAQLLGVTLLPLAAGLSGIATTHGVAFSAGFSRAMWIGAAFLAAGAPIAWVTVPSEPPRPKPSVPPSPTPPPSPTKR